MKQIISVRDLEELVRAGQDLKSLPGDALLTPSARDFLREHQPAAPTANSASRSSEPPAPTKPVAAASSKAEHEAFFNSPAIHELKVQICDIGRRLWQRAYVD